MGDLVGRYIEEKLPHLADQKETSRRLEWWAGQLGQDTRLCQITPASIASARDRLARGKGLSGKAVSPSTVRRYLTVLGSAMSMATKEWFWMEDNPCSKVVRPTEPRGRVRCLDGDERQRLLAACEESQTRLLYPLVVMALCTGARRGELLRLTWQDVDLDRGVAIIHHSKNGERRALAITGLAASVLKEWSRVRRLGSDPVFAGRGGKATFPQRAWQVALEAAGIEDFRFHDLRHTFASYLAMSGATLAELAEALGHKTFAMVKRYAHLTEGHTASVVARMTQRFVAA
ncbi:MAG: site-specific integrase [bacterium]|nr:site-specific integrase [bacterium]